MTAPALHGAMPASGRERLLQRLELLVALVTRNLRLRHDGRSLGAVWSLGPLLVQVAILVFVFVRVVPAGVDDYAAFVFTGLLAWTWLARGLQDAPWSIVQGRDLVRRPRFPIALLPAVSVGAPLVPFALGLPILLGVIWADTGRVPLTAALLPAVLAVQAILMLGPAILVAAITVRHRAAQNVVAAVMTVLFYGSPILYSADDVPRHVQPVYDLNPIVHLLDAYRDVLVDGRLPQWSLAAVLAVGIAVLAVATTLFARMEGSVVDDL